MLKWCCWVIAKAIRKPQEHYFHNIFFFPPENQFIIPSPVNKHASAITSVIHIYHYWHILSHCSIASLIFSDVKYLQFSLCKTILPMRESCQQEEGTYTFRTNTFDNQVLKWKQKAFLYRNNAQVFSGGTETPAQGKIKSHVHTKANI